MAIPSYYDAKWLQSPHVEMNYDSAHMARYMTCLMTSIAYDKTTIISIGMWSTDSCQQAQRVNPEQRKDTPRQYNMNMLYAPVDTHRSSLLNFVCWQTCLSHVTTPMSYAGRIECPKCRRGR